MTLSGYPYDQSAGIGSWQGYDPTGLSGSVDAAFIAPQLSGKNPAEDVTRMQSELTKYATYAPAGMKPIRARVKHDKGGSTITIGFGFWDTQDQIIKGGTSATNADYGNTWVTKEVVAWPTTGTPAVKLPSIKTVADALWATFSGTDYAYALSVSELPDGRVQVTKQYRTTQQRKPAGAYFVVSGRTYTRTTPVKKDASDELVYVYVWDVLQHTTSRWQYRIGNQSAIIREFTLRLNSNGNTTAEYTDRIGKVNAEAFLGLPKGQCMYLGLSYNSTFNPATQSFEMDLAYSFMSSDFGFATIPEMDMRITATSVTGDGWKKAVDLGLGGAVTDPPAVTFAGFIPS